MSLRARSGQTFPLWPMSMWLQAGRHNGVTTHFEACAPLIWSECFDQLFHDPLAGLWLLKLNDKASSNHSVIEELHNVLRTTSSPCRSDRHPFDAGEAGIGHQ